VKEGAPLQWLWPLLVLLAFAVGASILDRNPSPLSSIEGAQQAPQVKAEGQAKDAVQPKADPGNKQNNPTPAQPTIKIVHPGATAAEGGADTEKGSDEASEFWLVLGRKVKITDCLLVIFTALLFGATVMLWWHTRRLVVGAERTAETQLRAYVAIRENNVQFTVSDENRRIWLINPIWYNSGATPAQRVVQHASAQFLPGGLLEGFDFPDLDAPGRFDSLTMGAAQEIHGRIVSVEAADIERSRNQVGGVYYWGWLDYDDVLSETPRRRCEFCFRLDVLGAANATAQGWVGFRPEGRYNGTDKDCFRQPSAPAA
jgi:hypothetical protein